MSNKIILVIQLLLRIIIKCIVKKINSERLKYINIFFGQKSCYFYAYVSDSLATIARIEAMI